VPTETIYLPKEEYDFVRKTAKAEKKSVSAVITELIREFRKEGA
jgi:predicted CopG family antitoxin